MENESINQPLGQWDNPTVPASGTSSSTIIAAADTTGFSTLLDTDGDNSAQSVKASAGNLYHIEIYNSNVEDAFVQLFDAATGDVTVGTTTPKFVLYVPGQGGSVRDYNIPMSFATAISYACTTTATGNGDPTTGLTIAFGYK